MIRNKVFLLISLQIIFPVGCRQRIAFFFFFISYFGFHFSVEPQMKMLKESHLISRHQKQSKPDESSELNVDHHGSCLDPKFDLQRILLLEEVFMGWKQLSFYDRTRLLPYHLSHSQNQQFRINFVVFQTITTRLYKGTVCNFFWFLIFI